MQTLLPEPDPAPDLELLYAVPNVPAVRLGFVVSVDGTAAVDGRSAALSGPPDRQVFSLLRSLADVVLVGAGTARTEGYRPVPVTAERRARRLARGQRATPVVAVVTRGAGLPADSPLLDPAADTLLLRPRSAAGPVPPGVTLLPYDTLAGALAALRERGLPQVLCEGGPTLAGSLVAAGLVDELCLTTSPLLAGSPGPRLLELAGDTRALTLRHLLHEDSALLARWSVT